MIDVIFTANTRPPCANSPLIRYNVSGVVLALAKKGLDPRFVDLMPDKEGNVSALSEQDPADVCCYAVFFGNKVSAFRQMEDARRASKAPRLIIAFGSFASVFSEEILSRGLADMVVSADPEFVIPAVLQAGDTPPFWETIPNLSYIHEGKVIHTRKHSFLNLDEAPFVSPYLYSQGHRPAFITTARGCQYHCVFCDRNVLWGGGVRNRSVDNVLQEIKELVNGRQVPIVEFLDEDLAADHKRLTALCEGMHRMGGEFYWRCSACVDSVSQKMLLLMGRCGCREIHFGVESASPQVLRKIGKTYGRQDILNAVRWSREAGIEVEVMITIGNPGETDLDRDLTLSTINELGPGITIRTNRLVVLPGTAFYRKGLSEGRFTQKSFFEEEGVIFY